MILKKLLESIVQFFQYKVRKTTLWQREVQQVTTSDTSDNEWQQVTTSGTTSDKKWQRMVMSDSELEQWYSKWKRHSALQRMDDCHHFNDKKRSLLLQGMDC